MKNWLNPEEIFIIQPQTPEEASEISADIHRLAALQPQYEPDYIDAGIRYFPQAFTVIYHDDQPVAYIEINDNSTHDLGKDTLEFGGAVLEMYRDKGLTLQVAPQVIRQAFARTGKKKMLAFVPKDNQEARIAITVLGFKYFGDLDGVSRYKLDRSTALA